MSMQFRKLLYQVMVLAILLISATQAYAQVSLSSIAKITKLDNPTTVAVGKPLTISVTVSYRLGSQFEWLLVAIQDSTAEEEPPKPFPTIANSCPPLDGPWNQSICLYHASSVPGNFTVTFTLTAPDQPTKWDLYAAAAVVVMEPKSKQLLQFEKGDVWNFQVTVTSPQMQSGTRNKTISLTSSPRTIASQTCIWEFSRKLEPKNSAIHVRYLS